MVLVFITTFHAFLTLNLFQVMGECHSTQVNDEVAAKYRLISGSQDSETFLEFCLHTVLYQPPQQGSGIHFTLVAVSSIFEKFFFFLHILHELILSFAVVDAQPASQLLKVNVLQGKVH